MRTDQNLPLPTCPCVACQIEYAYAVLTIAEISLTEIAERVRGDRALIASYS
jgi:hypothetical protein